LRPRPSLQLLTRHTFPDPPPPPHPPSFPTRRSSDLFAGARRLTDQQIDIIQRWVADGAIEGDRRDLPPPPQPADGWRLGVPDLIVTLRDPYVVQAGGADALRNFVIPLPIDRVRYVSGIEFRPGN